MEVPQAAIIAQHPAGDRDMMANIIRDTRIYCNHLYQVIVRVVESGVGPLLQLAISRLDQTAVHDWRHLQLIKNALIGAESEAVELYPAESRLVDVSNTMYLFGLPTLPTEDGRPSYGRFPFGFEERAVSERPPAGRQQRPWPPSLRPTGLTDLSLADMRRRFAAGQAEAPEPIASEIVPDAPALPVEETETPPPTEPPGE